MTGVTKSRNEAETGDMRRSADLQHTSMTGVTKSRNEAETGDMRRSADLV